MNKKSTKKTKTEEKLNRSVVDEFKEELAKHVDKKKLDVAFNALVGILGKDSLEAKKIQALKKQGKSFLRKMESTARRMEKSSKQVAKDMDELFKSQN